MLFIQCCFYLYRQQLLIISVKNVKVRLITFPIFTVVTIISRNPLIRNKILFKGKLLFHKSGSKMIPIIRKFNVHSCQLISIFLVVLKDINIRKFGRKSLNDYLTVSLATCIRYQLTDIVLSDSLCYLQCLLIYFKNLR